MRNIYRLLKNILYIINNRLAKLCGVLLLIIMALLTINVVTRQIGTSIPGLTTLSVMVMVAVVYLGLSTAEENNDHASVDILHSYLPSKFMIVIDMMVDVLKIIAISIFFYISISDLISSYQSKEVFADIIKIPIWPAKLAISVGLLFFGLQIILNLFENAWGFYRSIKKSN